jgi:hypothetical protein
MSFDEPQRGADPDAPEEGLPSPPREPSPWNGTNIVLLTALTFILLLIIWKHPLLHDFFIAGVFGVAFCWVVYFVVRWSIRRALGQTEQRGPSMFGGQRVVKRAKGVDGVFDWFWDLFNDDD